MTVYEANIQVKQMMAEASDETLKDLEYYLRGEYAKYNGVSDYNPDKNYPAMMGISTQLENVRAEIKKRNQ